MNEYEIQAEEFLTKTGTTFKAVLLGHFKQFPDDTEKRDVYEITLERKGKSYAFKFGQCLAKSGGKHELDRKQKYEDACRKAGRWPSIEGYSRTTAQKPTAFDVLACLEKYDPETFEDFCTNYGYDTDSRSALQTYLAVQDEFKNVIKLFGDVLEDLQDLT
mgnify:CR=1 FL=1